MSVLTTRRHVAIHRDNRLSVRKREETNASTAMHGEADCLKLWRPKNIPKLPENIRSRGDLTATVDYMQSIPKKSKIKTNLTTLLRTERRKTPL